MNQPNAWTYVTGGTLAPGAPSYVERRADRDLLESLGRGETCYVLNSRQMGKSSLCVRTIGRLKEAGVRTAFLDLTKFGGRNLTAEQWYAALLSEVGRDLGLRSEFLTYWKENAGLPPVQRLFGAITELGLRDSSPLVVFVDEIDVTLSLPFSADEFFAAIRQCYVGRATDEKLKRLAFCLLGTATPADLIQDTRVSPFNIGRRIELSDFTDAEASPLAAGLGDAALLRRVLHWTGGHPYLTQRLCQAVRESDTRDVDKVCSDLFLTHSAKDSDDNLAFVRNRLLKSEADLAALLDLYRQMREGRSVPDDETNPLCALLKLSGVARVEAGKLKVRNRIYEHVFDKAWVETHMPGAEMRRQKVAYRRGVVRTATIGGLVITVLVLLVGATLTNARQARESQMVAVAERENSEKLLYHARMRLVQQGWEDDNLGQAIGLLDTTRNSPYKGFEWYYWQGKIHASELKTTMRCHSDKVNSVTFSPDGELLASASDDATAKITDVSTGRTIRTLEGHTDVVNVVTFSRDGRLLATGSGDNTAKIWDASTGREIVTLKGHTNGVMNVAFSPDGTLLVTTSNDKTAKVWQTETGKVLKTLRGHTDAVWGLSISPDGKVVATGSKDCTANIWDLRSGRLLWKLIGHQDYVDEVQFSPNGKWLATGSCDKTVRLWDQKTGLEIKRILQPDLVFGMAVSTDSRFIACASTGLTTIWDVQSGRQTSSLKGHTQQARCVAFSPKGTLMATSSFDKTIKVWDPMRRKTPFVLHGHSGYLFSVAISPLGDRLATASSDKTAKIWSVQSGKELCTLRGHSREVFEVTFSPDGGTVATASFDGSARLWDAETGQELRNLKGHRGDVNSVAFSPDGQLLATGSMDKTAKLWDASSGREVRTLKGHMSEVHGVRFSPDGRRLITGSFDQTAKIWDTMSGREIATLKGHKDKVQSVAWSPDGNLIGTGSSDGTAILWNSMTGARVHTLTGNRIDIWSLVFSPDSKRVATCAETAKLWDTETGSDILTLKGHLDWVNSIVFSPDSKRLFTASYDKTLRGWEAASVAQVQQWGREEQREKAN